MTDRETTKERSRRTWRAAVLAIVFATLTAPAASASTWQEQCLAAGGVYDAYKEGFDLIQRCTFYGADGKPVDIQLQPIRGYYRPSIHPGLPELELHQPGTPMGPVIGRPDDLDGPLSIVR